MNSYSLSFVKTDIPYIIEAIGLRAITLQESIRMQVASMEELERRKADEERRAAMPDPFESDKPITINVSATKQEPLKPSRKQKRAALMRVLKSKTSAELSTAEIARRAGVSYVTAMKARSSLIPKKGKK